MMVLLEGHSLTPRDKFQPERLGLQLSERASTATMTAWKGTLPAIAVGDWMTMEEGPAAGIVWRVKRIDEQVDTETVTVSLEHAVSALRDRIMFGEITPAVITGNPKATTCSATQAIRYILSWQSDWELAANEYSVNNPYNFNGENLFDALETVTASLEDAAWELDMRRYPFRIRILRLTGEVATEMRTDRNIRTMQRTVDLGRMFTRFYPIGKNNLKLGGNGYVSRNENKYGVYCKIEADQSLGTQEELRAWALERLRRHSEPGVTVTISGMDLAEATGEPLDSFTINKLCRVPLPEYGNMMITERVTKLSYADVIADPVSVTVTLANELQDVAKILRQQQQSSARGARDKAKKDEEDHAWFVDTTDHVAMVAEAVAGPGASKDWSRVAEIVVDGQGIHQRVTKTEGDMVVAQTRIEANEEAITLEATRAMGAEGEMSGRITVNAENITAEVTRASAAEGTLSGRITVNAENITAEVTRATTAEGTLSGRITVNAENITAEVTRATGAEGTLSGRISVNADNITAEVSRAAGEEQRLEGLLIVEAGKAGLVAQLADNRPVMPFPSYSYFPDPGDAAYIYYDKNEGSYWEWKNNRYVSCTGPGATINAASIVTSINNAGESEAIISANHVSITGNTKLSGTLTIDDGALVVKKSTVIQGNLTLTTAGSYIQAPSVSVSSGGHLRLIGSAGGEYYDLTATTIKDYIKKAEVDGNTLKLWKVSDSTNPSITFSKATSLSGEWSGGDYIVTASPQGNRFTVPLPMRLNGTTQSANFSAEILDAMGTTAKKSIYGWIVLTEDGADSHVDVNTAYDGSGSDVARLAVGSLYTDGYASAKISASWSGNSFSYSKGTSGVNSGSFTVVPRFGVSSGNYYVEVAKTEGGSTAGVPDAWFTVELARDGDTIEIQDGSGNRISDSPTYALTAHNNCAAGLTRAMVNGNLIRDKLYYSDNGVYKAVTENVMYWYYKAANTALTTYYS